MIGHRAFPGSAVRILETHPIRHRAVLQRRRAVLLVISRHGYIGFRARPNERQRHHLYS